MTPGARVQAAIEILEAVDAQRAPADVVAGGYFKSRRYIGAKDRAAIAGLVYGVLRHRAQLDWWLARVARDADGSAADNRRRAIAWLAVGEGWPAERIGAAFDGGRFRPPRLSPAEARLVDALIGRTLEHPAQPPWVRHNYPEWLHPALRARFGDDLASEMAALGMPAPLDLRANALKTTRDEALRRLAAEGLEVTPTRWSPWGIRVNGRPPLTGIGAFREGLVEVQDEGSQLAALLVAARPGFRVCDFCAGAAGKSLAIAAAMANKGRIVALDVSGKRLEGATRRLRRAGVFNVEARTLSSERDPWVKRHRASFDRVLVDAPCSGTGTWRRNPDGKWALRPVDIDELTALQRRILDSAARLVRPGGRLVYVTCSVLPAENEDQIEWFRNTHAGFRPVPVVEIWAETIGGAPPTRDTYLRLSPARHGTDGFFVAVLESAQAADAAPAET